MRLMAAVVPQPPDLCKDTRFKGISTEGWIAISVVLGFIGGFLVGFCASWVAFKRRQQRLARTLLPEPTLTTTPAAGYTPAAKEKLFSPLRTSVKKLSVNESHESLNWQSARTQSVSSQYPASATDSFAQSHRPYQDGLYTRGLDSPDRTAHLPNSIGSSSRSDLYLVKDSHLRTSLTQSAPHQISQPPAQLLTEPSPHPPNPLLTQPLPQPVSQTLTRPTSHITAQPMNQTLTRVASNNAGQPMNQTLTRAASHNLAQPVNPLLTRTASNNSAQLHTHPTSQAAHQVMGPNSAAGQAPTAAFPQPASWSRTQTAPAAAGPTPPSALQLTGAPRPAAPPAASLRPVLAATSPLLAESTQEAPSYNPFLDPALAPDPPIAAQPPHAHNSAQAATQSMTQAAAQSGGPARAIDPRPIPLMTPEPILEECESPTMSLAKGFAFPVLQGGRESKEQESLGELLLSEMDNHLHSIGQPPMLPLERKTALKLLLAERSGTFDVDAALQHTLDVICADRTKR